MITKDENIMSKMEMTKKEFRNMVEEFIGNIKLVKIFFDGFDKGQGDLFCEVLAEEIGKLISHRPCEKFNDGTMNFGMAIEEARQGKKIARKGWNGKSQYVELATCISYRNADGCEINAEHQSIGNKAFAFVGTSGVQLGWLASQADMLADDWVVVE